MILMMITIVTIIIDNSEGGMAGSPVTFSNYLSTHKSIYGIFIKLAKSKCHASRNSKTIVTVQCKCQDAALNLLQQLTNLAWWLAL